MKQGDMITVDISGTLTEVTVNTIGEDGTIFGVIDEKTLIQFKVAHVERPKRGMFRSFFSVGQ